MVTRLQAVISREVKTQLLEKEGRDYPDYLIACVGGGSNAAGLYYHYLNNEKVKIIAVEAAGKELILVKVQQQLNWVKLELCK